MNFFFILPIIVSFLFGAYPKKDDISAFLDAKFSGDTSLVNRYLSDDFIYHHAPFIGLGIKAFYVDGALLVTDVSNDTLQTKLSVGDRIHEFDGKIVTKEGIFIKGAVGDIQELLITKKDSSDFLSLKIPLSVIRESESSYTFLEKIKKYSELWYDYDFTLNEFFSKKNKIFIHYSWEGSLEENSKVYHFDAFEVFTTDKKTGLILDSKSLWNELQFRNQFK